MEPNFEQRSLGDCAKFFSGGTPSKSNPDYWVGSIPWVSCKDMKVPRLYDAEDHLSEEGCKNGTRLIQPGTILIVVRGMILAKEFPVAMAMREVAFNQDLKALCCNDGVDSWFLYFWLLANSYEVRGLVDEAAHGTKRLQSDRLLNLQVNLPPLNTQRKIASILSAYDDLIENNTRRIKTLEEMARMIYREWFVNFRFPRYEQVKMVDSPLGMIPEGWEVRDLLDLSEVTYGFAFKADQFSVESIGKPVIRIRDVLEGRSNTFSTEKPADKYLVQNGDVLVGMDGDFHMGFWVGGEAYLVQRVARFRSKSEISNYHLFLAMEKPIQDFDATITGTTVAHLGDKHIKTIQIAWPDAELLAKSTQIFDPLLKHILTLRLKNQNLRQTRDLLLSKLISGEVAVS